MEDLLVTSASHSLARFGRDIGRGGKLLRRSDAAKYLFLFGRSGRICSSFFQTLKSLTFSNAGFDFVYSPCVLVSRRLQPLRTATHSTQRQCPLLL